MGAAVVSNSFPGCLELFSSGEVVFANDKVSFVSSVKDLLAHSEKRERMQDVTFPSDGGLIS